MMLIEVEMKRNAGAALVKRTGIPLLFPPLLSPLSSGLAGRGRGRYDRPKELKQQQRVQSIFERWKHIFDVAWTISSTCVRRISGKLIFEITKQKRIQNRKYSS